MCDRGCIYIIDYFIEHGYKGGYQFVWWLSIISTIELIIEQAMRHRLGGVHCQTY
jgi:hypothetical protein